MMRRPLCGFNTTMVGLDPSDACNGFDIAVPELQGDSMVNVDRLVADFDKAVRVIAGVSAAARPSPADSRAEAEMDGAARRHSAGLMRVNHVGEVCAQALYDAQGRFARDEGLRRQFAQAGRDEEDHLAWTAERVRELGSRTSLLNPLWYAGAFLVGAAASRVGDAASLGFVVETERQVAEHLEGHLNRLPAQDQKSRAIVAQMREDEIGHGSQAQALGAADVPRPVSLLMRAMARVMTTTAYYI